MPLASHLEYQRARARVHSLIIELIARRRATPPEEWPEDLLSKLMLARDEETGECMTDLLVRDESLGIFIVYRIVMGAIVLVLFATNAIN